MVSLLYESTIYSTFHGSTCYRVILFIETVNVGVFAPGTVSDIHDEVLDKLEEILGTFRFLD